MFSTTMKSLAYDKSGWCAVDPLPSADTDADRFSFKLGTVNRLRKIIWTGRASIRLVTRYQVSYTIFSQ